MSHKNGFIHADERCANNEKAAIGLFGGTFDPIHQGHVKTVSDLASRLELEQVIVMPCHLPPHKQQPGVDAQHRLAMTQLACEDQPLLQVSDWELNQNGPSYSINTLEALKKAFPQRSIFMFIGMDSLRSFTLWHRWQDILDLCHLVVSSRPGYTHKQLPPELTSCLVDSSRALRNGDSGKIYIHDGEKVSVSSSDIRSQIAHWQDCPEVLAPKVFAYIKQHKLYS